MIFSHAWNAAPVYRIFMLFGFLVWTLQETGRDLHRLMQFCVLRKTLDNDYLFFTYIQYRFIVQIFSFDLYSTVQIYITDIQYRSRVQLYCTYLQYRYIVQIHSTDLQYISTVQIYSTDPQYISIVQFQVIEILSPLRTVLFQGKHGSFPYVRFSSIEKGA